MTAAGEMESEPPPAAAVMATARMSVAMDRTRIVELLIPARLPPELLSDYVPGDGGGNRSGGDGVADFDFQSVKGNRADCGVGVDDDRRVREQLAVEPHRCAAVRRFQMRGDSGHSRAGTHRADDAEAKTPLHPRAALTAAGMAGDIADVEPGVAAGRGKAAVRGGGVDEDDRERVVDDRLGRTSPRR